MKTIFILATLAFASSTGYADEQSAKPARKPASGEFYCYTPNGVQETIAYVEKSCDKDKPFSVSPVWKDKGYLVCCTIKK